MTAKMKKVASWYIIFIFLRLLVLGSGDVYIVTMEGEPVVSYNGGIEGFSATSLDLEEEMDITSESVTSYSLHLVKQHDTLLDSLFDVGTYKKLYSYHHLLNGFSVHMSPEQAEVLSKAPGVKYVGKDMKVKKLTTHTPQFLGLPTGVWPTGGGFEKAGEDIVIGFVDSGIYPKHPSFSAHYSEPYGPLPRYRGKCEIDPDTKRDFCNGKIIGAQHFAKAAIAAGAFNPEIDFASPLDGDGHGSHTAAIAAGNNGIPVRMHGHEFGKASGMAPRARIAVYKVLYRLFGGYVSDVVAAIDQAVRDGVDILNLSVGPNSPPSTTRTTFLNPFDASLLAAVKAGVFVAQAAGNGGPFPKTLVSFSPWITTVAAAVDDRRYKNNITLGNGKILSGLGLSPSTQGNRPYNLVSANDVIIDSSVLKFNPGDCQRPELLNRKMVEGNILLCGYSFNFVSGTASIRKASETANSLGAAGFIVAVENSFPGAKFDPVPVANPGILIADVSKSKVLIDYYNSSTKRDWAGRPTSFQATANISDGLAPILHSSAPQVALFSSRGPDVKDFSFQDADVLKPDILAPGSLIWAAWAPNGTDEANYCGEGFAMESGTSMAAPHIAGIAALIKQKHPRWSPAAIKSALMTTATTMDRGGKPLQAQQYSETEATKLLPATPFDFAQLEAMAGGFVGGDVGKRAALYEGRITSYFILACVVGSLGGSLFGYDLGVSGGVTSMDDFLKDFFPKVYQRKQAHLHETDYCKYDNQVLTLFTSSLYFAGLLSTFGASLVTRKYGRRISIMTGAVSFFLGGCVNAAAVSIFMLILGRILLGIGIGFGNQAVPLYLSEIAPPKIRGAVNQLFQLTTCLGILVADIINYFTEQLHPWGWRLSLGLATVPATLMFVGGFFLPETPNSLVEQGRLDEARVILEKVRGTKKVDAEFEDLKDASEAARQVKHPFRNLFKPKNRPQLVIGALGIPAFQQLSGMNSILFYSPVIFQSLGFGSGAALYSSIITSSMLVLGALVSMSLVDRLGRRFFFIEAGIQMIICMAIVASTLATSFGHGVQLPHNLAMLLVISICLFVVAYGWAWGPLGWLVPSEIFPLETRSAGQSMVVCVNLFFTAAIAQCFLASLCHLRWGVFVLFAALIVIMSLFIYFLLPETKQVPIEEMSYLWENHWFWKSIVSKGDGDDEGARKPVNGV